jgi:hypothetical protein
MHSDATESGFKGRIFDSPAFAMAVTKADRMKMKEAEKLRRLKAQVEPTSSYLEFEKLRAAAMAAVAEDVLNNRLKAERAEAAKKANKEKTTTSSPDSSEGSAKKDKPKGDEKDKTEKKRKPSDATADPEKTSSPASSSEKEAEKKEPKIDEKKAKKA